VVILTFGCAGGHDDVVSGGDLRLFAQGLPFSEYADDDEQIVQCLEHVRLLGLLWYFFAFNFVTLVLGDCTCS
jgi:hypothetical protein